MSTYAGPMCDLDDELESMLDLDEGESLYTLELRSIVEEFDILMDTCWEDQLTPQESERLNILHMILNEREDSYWDGVSPEAVNLLRNHLDIDFPMIRYLLGMIPLVSSV